jgi:hypothetical protein
METINSDSDLQLVKQEPIVAEPPEEPIVAKAKTRGRPRKYEEGAKSHEKEIKYSSNYYRENKDKKITCEYCKKEIVYIYKHQHYKSKVCQVAKLVKSNPENVYDELERIFS